MKVQGISIRFTVSVLFELARMKGYKTVSQFSELDKLTPEELLQVIRLCMIAGEKAEGRQFDMTTEELADMLTPKDLNDIILYIADQNRAGEPELPGKKKAARRRGLFRFKS